MKKLIVLAGVLSLALVSFTSANTPSGPCCPAGANAQAVDQAQHPADHAAKPGCCSEQGTCMKAEGGKPGCCAKAEDGTMACCKDADADGACDCCGGNCKIADGCCSTGEGCCSKKDASGKGCCASHGEGKSCCTKKDVK